MPSRLAIMARTCCRPLVWLVWLVLAALSVAPVVWALAAAGPLVVVLAIAPLPARAEGFTPPTARASASVPLDLLGAWRLARASDPVLAAAEATRRSVQEGRVQAEASRWPRLSASVQTAGNDRPADPHTVDTTATVQQPLFDRARDARIAQARALTEAQDATLAAAEQALAARVASAYLDALASTEALARTEEIEAALRRQVQQAEQRHAIGLSAFVDVEQARAAMALARAASVRAHQDQADALDALATLTGEPAVRLAPLREDAAAEPPQPAGSADWVARALAEHPLLRAAERGLAAADAAVAAARAQHWPTLEASASAYRSRAAGPAPNHGTRWGVVLNVPLFSGGSVQSQVRQSQAQRDLTREDAEGLRRRIVQGVLGQHRAVGAGAEQVAAGAEAVAAAGRALESLRAGQQLGTRSITDVLQAIQQLSGAQLAYSQARHRQVLAGLLLLQAAGRLGEGDLARVNGLLR